MENFYTYIGLTWLAIGLSCNLHAHPCNGSELLCKRRYNEVVYPTTHNGHSYKQADVANQDIPLNEQFEQGIRATKLHVWYDVDSTGTVVPFVCHGIDKKLLYDPPVSKLIEHTPFMLRSCVRSLLEKCIACKEIILDACRYAYGTDNSPGAIPFKHCILDPAGQPFLQALQQVATFLRNNSYEVMTLIIEDHTRNLERLACDFQKADLMPYVHIQSKDEAWPTLQQMIDGGKRLVVLLHGDADLDYKQFPWMHYLWDYAWDTKSDFNNLNQLKDIAYDTVPHRGQQAFANRDQTPHNKLFVVHHFITDLIGGSKNNALKANRKSVLRSRLKRLQQTTGHLPTLVQVDFFEYPAHDFFNVINELNGV